MLEYLRIRNLALIDDMELEFEAGMNVLTGETGAGKSFILKALGFLLGDKLSSDMVRSCAKRASVEAVFHFSERDLHLRRELASESGRSRIYVNDELHSQDYLRDLRPKLVVFTSQHAQQKLMQASFQADLLERDMHCEELTERREFLLAALHDHAAKRNALLERQSSLAEKRELMEMQQEEIDKIAPEEGEEERLEILRTNVRAIEHLRKNYDHALALLHGDGQQHGILDQLNRLEKILSTISSEDACFETDKESIATLRQQIQYLDSRLRHPAFIKDIDENDDMDRVEERLFALANLKRKLHRTLPEILSLRKEIAENLSFLDLCALNVRQMEKEEKALKNELTDIVTNIKPLRRNAAVKTAKALENELRQLGFSEAVRVIPDFVPYEIWPGVIDERGRILWAPNPGQPEQALDKIASGGELSRFLLALTSIQKDNESATFLFDEVDAGVGGLTLNKLAEKLSDLASKRQIILITHWPQLAVRARKHFQIIKVIRDCSTSTLCTPLNNSELLAELARMAGGGTQGEALAMELKNTYL